MKERAVVKQGNPLCGECKRELRKVKDYNKNFIIMFCNMCGSNEDYYVPTEELSLENKIKIRKEISKMNTG